MTLKWRQKRVYQLYYSFLFFSFTFNFFLSYFSFVQFTIDFC
jgi:hypothetical protein